MTEPKRPRGRPPKQSAGVGEKPELTKKQWLGLSREIKGSRNKGLTFNLDTEWPSNTPLSEVAAHAGVSKVAVAKWRKAANYHRGLIWLLAEDLGNARQTKMEEEAAEKHQRWANSHASHYSRLSAINKRRELVAFARQNWTGPTAIGGKVFSTPEEYADEMLRIGAIPAEWNG